MRSSVTVNADSSTTRTMMDDENTITLATSKEEGKVRLTVKDRDGHVIYDGALGGANVIAGGAGEGEVAGGEKGSNGTGMQMNGGPGMVSTLNRKDGEQDITLRTDHGKGDADSKGFEDGADSV